MTFLPVAARELRAAARRPATYWTRFSAALTATGISALVFFASGGDTVRSTSVNLFVFLSGLAFLYALFAGVRHTADCLSEEKREGTLGLLFLTDLKGYDVVAGKLTASSITALYALCALFPLLAFPLLLGGVEPATVWRMVALLVNTLFLSLTAGLVVSAFSRDARRAATGTLGLILLLAVGVPWIAWLIWSKLHGAAPGDPPLALLYSSAPVAWFRIISETSALPVAKPSPDFYLRSMLTLHALGWSFLAIACWRLPHSWQDRPLVGRAARLRERWHRLAFGEGAARAALRGRLLDRNPLLWLGARDRFKPLFLWIVFAVIGVGWLWIFLEVGRDWLAPGAVATAFALHAVLKNFLAAEASLVLGEQRRSGALEQLLSTPVTVDEILGGLRLAVRRHFISPFVAVVLVDLALLAAALRFGSPSAEDAGELALAMGAGLTVLAFDGYALAWDGMWSGMTARNANQAAGATVARILILPWVIFGLGMIFYAMLDLDRRFTFEFKHVLGAWVFLACAVNFYFLGRARRRLRSGLRTLAAAQYAPPRTRWWRTSRGKSVATKVA